MTVVDLELPILRTSERKDFKRCPQRWWWAWRMGLRPRHPKLGALWFGTGIHLAFEHWYIPGTKRGIDPRITWQEFVGEQVEHVKVESAEVEKVWMEAGDLGYAMLTSYLETYGDDDEWEILAVELPFQVKIARPGTNEPVVIYAGTLDVVARHRPTGKVYLWDHKTAAQIQTGHLPLDDQAGSYWAVATHILRKQGILGPKEVIHGILYNFLMKSPPDPRPRDELGRARNQPKKEHYVKELVHHYGSDNDPGMAEAIPKMKLPELVDLAAVQKITVLGDVSGTQPSKRFERKMVHRTLPERKKQVERIASEITVMDMFRYGELPLYKNPTKDCQWDCDFRQLCELDERGGDTDEYIRVVYQPEDPYAAHRQQEREEV